MKRVCRELGLPRSTYYTWLKATEESRPSATGILAEERLIRRIKELCMEFPTYGYRRIWALLVHKDKLQNHNGSAFGAATFVAEVARQGLHLTKTFYRSPEENAIVERFFWSLKSK